MKVVVFAHTPPPHHGQSYMVQLMLDGLGGDQRKLPTAQGAGFGIRCYHVNARVSKNLEDVGGARSGKLFLMVRHCLEAIWCRFRYGADIFYYVPAPGKRAALYRDWLVMALCRPFFRHTIFHWHATSLAKWIETCCTLKSRALAFRLMGGADLSIVLSRQNRFNAEKLWPRRIAVVPNGIPDPCRDWESVLRLRKERLEIRGKLVSAGSPLEQHEAETEPEVIRVLFLAHCTREKGLFDAAEAVLIANAQLKERKSPLKFRLLVAGIFPDLNEKLDFERLCKDRCAGEAIRYAGFVQGDKKSAALVNADLLCFPSHWENQPVTVIESLAFGLPAVVSDLPSVVEMLPESYIGVARVRDPGDTARALLSMIHYANFEQLRSRFESQFEIQRFHANIAGAFALLDQTAG